MVLAALWFLLSGHTEPLLLWLGGGSIVVVVLIANRMDLIDREGHPFHLSWRAIGYFPWLLIEIAKANIDVAKVIIQPEMPIQPKFFRVKASQLDELGHAIYANSITLTPGTVTVDLHEGMVEVHALTKAAREGVETGEMDAKVVDMEGITPPDNKGDA
ncbi:MAG: Na+/H+ antiporter subunit E [Rhodospirillales bacterium]|nr:Na+/H+ antiporter subunit E [Rhodospirillales bacterium]